MGQEPSTMNPPSGTATGETGRAEERTPDEIRREITGTRREMDQTLDAIEDRVSPRRIAERRTERLRQGWSGLRDRVMGQAEDLGDRAGSQTSGAGQSLAEAVRHGPEAVQRQTQGNPIAAGLIAFGAGLLAASLLPKTDAEQRAASQAAQQLDPVKQQLTDAGREVAESTKAHAQDAVEQTKKAASDAAATVQDDARTSADHLREEGQERAASVQQSAQSSG